MRCKWQICVVTLGHRCRRDVGNLYDIKINRTDFTVLFGCRKICIGFNLCCPKYKSLQGFRSKWPFADSRLSSFFTRTWHNTIVTSPGLLKQIHAVHSPTSRTYKYVHCNLFLATKSEPRSEVRFEVGGGLHKSLRGSRRKRL